MKKILIYISDFMGLSQKFWCHCEDDLAQLERTRQSYHMRHTSPEKHATIASVKKKAAQSSFTRNDNFLIRHSSILFTIFAMLALLSACSDTHDHSAEEEHEHSHEEIAVTEVELSQEQIQLSGIQVAKMQRQLLAKEIVATGRVDVPPQSMASISGPRAGFIRTILTRPAQYVRKGQVLARLAHPDYIELQQQYLEAKTHKQFLEQEVARQQELAKENATPLKNVQKSENDLALVKVQIAAYAAQLNLIGVNADALSAENLQQEIEVLAPISGHISAINCHVGQFVESQHVLFEMMNQKHLHLELQVFERDLPYIQEEQKILFHLNHSDQQMQANVHLINPALNPENQTLTIHGHLDNPDPSLKPHAFVTAKILMEADSVYALPERAILTEEGQAKIYVEHSPRHYQVIPIRTGRKQDGMVEILGIDGRLKRASVVIEGVNDVKSAFEKASGGEFGGHSH